MAGSSQLWHPSGRLEIWALGRLPNVWSPKAGLRQREDQELREEPDTGRRTFRVEMQRPHIRILVGACPKAAGREVCRCGGIVGLWTTGPRDGPTGPHAGPWRRSVRRLASGGKACRAFGKERLEHLAIHHGRHTFISHALAGRMTLAEVRDAAGHSNVTITSGYLHVAVEEDGIGGYSPDDKLVC